jgi:glycogen debranching enzyme
VEVSGLTSADAGRTELRLSGDQLRAAGTDGGVAWYVSSSGSDTTAVDHVTVGRQGNRFLIAVAPSRAAAATLFARAAAEGPRWTAERRARLAGLVTGDRYLRTDDARLTDALRWITLTTDVLVTRQRGDGIYAGLPWFNEYWGRDSFIALAGATLVTGRFEEARAILTSFARFQDLDRRSPFYGRLPNIVKPGSIDYHTTDGTPRWVIALRDYVRYSGDRATAAALYPNVAASIEGALARHTDSLGYLVHAENETWMDARREPDKASYSPRSTRANDIQALWHDQLRAGAEFAAMTGDTAAAARWTRAADRLQARFARDFVDAATGRVADRLDARGAADFALRPNLLFALDLVGDERVAARAARRAWEALVYPWGVATLDQRHPFFHPYHLAWAHYHKDEAYHNGTVWPWLNGIAMQRMIAGGQADLAWRLFAHTSDMALRRGVVGGLAETLDAYPHPGDSLPRLTGTFLQAWSNAEHLRVWYQDFLGVRPDMALGAVRLAPRLPAALGGVDFSARVGAGAIRGVYGGSGGARRYAWHLAGQPAALTLDVAPYAARTFTAAAGDRLEAEERGDGLHARLVSAAGAVRAAVVLAPSSERRARQAALDGVLAGTAFARPGAAATHPVMRQVYQRDARSGGQ